MTTSWPQVHHQAQRCRHLHDPDAQKRAVRLLFEMIRQAIGAPERKARQSEREVNRGA